MHEAPFTLAEVQDAWRRIEPHVVRTPVADWSCDEVQDALGAATGIVLKLELLQRTGTFKPRGALAVLTAADPAELARGITAVSAGNHAIASAYAARVLGVSAKVVMLATANAARVDRCRRLGAEVLIAPDGATAFAMVEQIRADEGRIFVHPFEGPQTALGTATLGVEFAEDAGRLDAVIIPIGGGGLCAGAANGIRLVQPNCRIFGVEPEGADTMRRSFAAGAPQRQDKVATIADSLAPPFTLPYSYDLCRRAVEEIVTIGDDEMRRGMDILFRQARLAVEPAGAAALAALLGPLRDELAGRRVGLVVCGTNIDFDSFAAHVARGRELTGRL